MKGTMPLSAAEQRLYDILRKAAEAGTLCPTNEVLVARMGLQTASGVSQIIRQIEQKGWLSVQRRTKWRRITILETGKSIESRKAINPVQAEQRKVRRAATQKPIQAPPQIEALRTSIEREAEMFQSRRAEARMLSSGPIGDTRPRSTFKVSEGGPCFMCGVKRADHDTLGCKQWRERT